MDSQTAVKVNVDDKIAVIKAQMPETYKTIQAEAAKRGRGLFETVRRGLRGEANQFYAFERGHVVGTPFSDTAVTAEIAACMVAFGRCSVCIFAPQGGPADGAH